MKHLPPAILRVAQACHQAGGRAWLVGGSVRDALLGLPVKDYDLEVHGLSAERLLAVLRGLGHVNEVGRSFGVFKLTLDRRTYDISLPRRDSKAGPGHRGIAVEGDPDMGVEEAARRRDLTINAMLQDPLTGELVDPCGGQADLRAGVLRAVDPDAFLEDPLRAVRVVQFAARFEMLPDPQLVDLCRAAPLDELPSERILGELEKMLLRARRPSLGLQVARRCAVLERVLPEVAGTPAVALDTAIDRAAGLRAEAGPTPRPLALMLAVLLHALDGERAEACLERLQVHTRARYPLRTRVLGAVAHWPQLADGASDSTLRGLAEHQELRLVGLTALAVTGSSAARQALQRCALLGIQSRPLPQLLRGRDLQRLGLSPGPAMGRVLAAVRRAQIEGRVEDVDGAAALARELIADPDRGQP